jgi:hypothetical protein
MEYYKYTNPQNGYSETVANADVLIALFMGGAFFIAKQVWGWAIIMSASFSWLITSLILQNESVIILSGAVYVLLICFTKYALKTHYRRMGWKEELIKT